MFRLGTGRPKSSQAVEVLGCLCQRQAMSNAWTDERHSMGLNLSWSNGITISWKPQISGETREIEPCSQTALFRVQDKRVPLAQHRCHVGVLPDARINKGTSLLVLGLYRFVERIRTRLLCDRLPPCLSFGDFFFSFNLPFFFSSLSFS